MRESKLAQRPFVIPIGRLLTTADHNDHGTRDKYKLINNVHKPLPVVELL